MDVGWGYSYKKTSTKLEAHSLCWQFMLVGHWELTQLSSSEAYTWLLHVDWATYNMATGGPV